MQKDKLTLRNLYNFLMIRDYPVYSTGIIGNEQKKGITLSKFWRDTLLPEFTGGKYGKMIWKNTGSRNRHTSEICNRSKQLTVYDAYMEELTDRISEDVILRQIGLLGVFLTNHQFSYKVFLIKIKALLECFAKEDASFGVEIQGYFADNLVWVKQQDLLKPEDEEFIAGWFLTLLSIHALTGDAMNSARMQALRGNPEYRIAALWEKAHKDTGKQKTTFLTTENCEICSKALSPEHFWGRESEQFALREKMQRGGHYLLSGIGGTGKTELLRQFLQYCLKNNVVEYVCAIQYENSFAESLMRAFARCQTGSFEDSFREVMGELKQYCAYHRVLILIDNINKTMEEDAYLRVLEDLSANIFATSRLEQMDGFETYKVHELDLKSCNLVFRDNYKFLLEKDEQQKLNTFLDKPIYRHTMTLRLLGQFAGAMSWTLDEMIQKIRVDEDTGLSREEETWLGLRKIYAKLYSRYSLNERQKGFLRIVAALPYRKYPIAFLNRYMAYMMEDASELFVPLLSEQGWLERSADAVSMHPVIAESILDKPISNEEVYQLYEAVADCWTDHFGDFEQPDCRERMLESEDEDFIRSSELVLDIFFKASFSVDDQWIPFIVLAAELVKKNYSLAKNRVERLLEILEQANQISDEIRIRGYVVCFDIMETFIPVLEKEIEKQQVCRTVSEDAYNQLANWTAHQLLSYGELEKAQALLMRENQPEDVNRYFQLGQLAAVQMKSDEAYQWSTKGIESAERDKKKYREDLFYLWALKTEMCSGTRCLDEAEEGLRQMEFYMNRNNVQQGWLYNFYKGSYFFQSGHPEEAVECHLKALEFVKFYYGEHNISYALLNEDIAMAQEKLNCFEEAEKHHMIALNYTTTQEGFAMEKSRILNNMAVMYLNWGKADAALEHAKAAYEIAGAEENLSMAEPAYNLARCYRAAGDTQRELEYLQKAYPVFARIYADRNEKTHLARERIEELTQNE